MSKEDPTPPRDLRTPPNPQHLQQATEDSTSDEDDAPDIWSEELFPLNIVPFSDNDAYHSTTSGSDNTEKEDEEEDDAEEAENHNDIMNQGQAQAQANPPANPPANPQLPPSGGQLSSVPPFSGTQGLDGLVYVEAIDRAREQFGWTQVQTARAAVTRGGNIVANWIRGERASGRIFTAWQEDNMVNLRPAFLARFGPKYTAGGAVAAIADLKQRSGETVGDFMDRVKIAVDMLHYNVEEADRNQAFRDGYARLVIAQFGGGVNSEIREQVFGVRNPPNTMDDVLAAAMAIESEKNPKATKLVINQVDSENPPQDKNKEDSKNEITSIAKECEELKKQMSEILSIGRNAYRGRGRGNRGGSGNNGKCYGCGQPGHIRANCPSPQQQPYQYYRGRGNGWRGRGRGRGRPYQTRRGRYASNFGASRGRPQFPIGDLTGQWDADYKEEEWGYNEYEDYEDGYDYQEHQGSGNDPWGRY